MAEKPHMNLVVIGHVDHGKSTLVGRILFDTGAVEKHILEKYKKEAEEKGKATFEFAWVMDRLKEERERGLTIDVAHQKFVTQAYYFTLIDAPGHRDFVKNMITGTSQADAAILVCSAHEGPQEQTKEHIFLAKTLGVNQVIVAINKMDMVSFEEAKYKKTVEEVSKLLKAVGYKPEEIPFVPTSGFKGDNVASKSDKTGWYKGATIIEALNKLKAPEKQTDKPLRIPVQDVYTIKGIGTVPVGRVEYGVLKPDSKVIFMPSGKVGKAKDIEMHHEKIKQAEPGDNIGFNVDIDRKEIRRGDMCGTPDNPPLVAKSFKAQIVVLNHPTVITEGYTPVFHCHTAQVACTFEELIEKKDPKSGQTVPWEESKFLKTGDAAIVKIRPTKPLCIEPAKLFPHLGRFAVRDMGQTVAAGMVMEVEKKTE
jgi:elongation factor 1-alpha